MGYRFAPPVDLSADGSTLESRSDPYANEWVIVETRLVRLHHAYDGVCLT
jgi:hypothetical protein